MTKNPTKMWHPWYRDKKERPVLDSSTESTSRRHNRLHDTCSQNTSNRFPRKSVTHCTRRPAPAALDDRRNKFTLNALVSLLSQAEVSTLKTGSTVFWSTKNRFCRSNKAHTQCLLGSDCAILVIFSTLELPSTLLAALQWMGRRVHGSS